MRIEDKRQIADTTNDDDSSVNQAQSQPSKPSIASSSLDVDWSAHAPQLPDFSGMVDSAKSAVVGYVKDREAQVKGDIKNVQTAAKALENDFNDPNVHQYVGSLSGAVYDAGQIAKGCLDIGANAGGALDGNAKSVLKVGIAASTVAHSAIALKGDVDKLEQSKAQGSPQIAQFNQHLREFIAAAGALNRDAGIH